MGNAGPKVGITKSGKEFNFKIDGYKCQYGTVKAADAKSIYLSVSGWLMIEECVMAPDKEMNRFRAKLRSYVYQMTNDIFGDLMDHNRTIRELNCSESSYLKVATSTFFGIDLNFFFHDVVDLKDKDMQIKFEAVCSSLIDLVKDYPLFSFHNVKIKKGSECHDATLEKLKTIIY